MKIFLLLDSSEQSWKAKAQSSKLLTEKLLELFDPQMTYYTPHRLSRFIPVQTNHTLAALCQVLFSYLPTRQVVDDISRVCVRKGVHVKNGALVYQR